MLIAVAKLIGGMLCLYFGAEWLVSGASGLARSMGVRPLVIGLTVVAYGTSAPELVVSVVAAMGGKSALALGNVIGSNIANLGLILGVTALVCPPRVDGGLIRREVPVLLMTALVVPAVVADSVVSRTESLTLLAMALAFSVAMLRSAKELAPTEPIAREAGEEAAVADPGMSGARCSALAVLGLALLLAGGKLFVDGSTTLALALGVSERVIGLTIVAIGTSLPELAASVMAAWRGHSDLAIGNVIGSNIFNVLLILGAAGAVSPLRSSLAELRFDLLALAAFTLVAAAMLRGDRTLSRAEGAVLVLGYAGFLAALALQ